MSYIKKILIALAILAISPLPLLAQVVIIEVFPNTEDDVSMEYIDIANTGCEDNDISGYQLADKEKSYTFAAGSILLSQGTMRVGRPLSKIALNNTNEELYLRDRAGNLLQSFAYATSIKSKSITVSGIFYDVCSTVIEDSAEDEENGDTSGPEYEESGEDIPTEEGEDTTESSSGGLDESDGIDSGTGIIDETEIIPIGGSGTLSEEGTEDEEEIIDSGLLDETDTPDTEILEEEEIQTSNLLGKSGSLDPQILLYTDEDGDGYIDTLEILYDIFLTGSIDIDKIYLYSATGGLHEYRINTATGHILDAEIEDNILRLFIEPATLSKTGLTIDATTASALRLKSISSYGVFSLSGLSTTALFLTSSFDSYRSVYEKSVYEAMLRDTGEVTNTGVVVSSILPPAFPDIVPTIQNYTNTSYIDGEFTCRESPCRLNLTFDTIFSSLYPSSAYSCEVRYGNGVEYKCNPSQWNPTSTTGFDVKIIHKATGASRSQYFPIHWNPVALQTNTVTQPILSDTSSPIVSIRLNGTLTKKQILIDDTLHCYTQTCSVNFDGSDSYDPDKNTMIYAWISDGIVFSTKKNPGVQDFSLGEHAIIFRITDASGKMAENIFRVVVHGDETIDREVQIVSNNKTSSNKKKSIKKHSFFSPPRLVLDTPSSKVSEIDGRFRCASTTPSCSMNFSLSDTTPGVLYQFRYAHETEPIWTSNPRSHSLKTGNYTLTVSAHYEKGGIPLWSQSYPIQISRIKKAPVIKKAPTKKSVKTSKVTKNNLDVIPSAYAENESTGDSSDASMLFVLFLSVMVNIFFLRKKRGILV